MYLSAPGRWEIELLHLRVGSLCDAFTATRWLALPIRRDFIDILMLAVTIIHVGGELEQ
jgi:hypothetical protein